MDNMSKFESCSRFLTWFVASLLVALAAGCGSGLSDVASIVVTPSTASVPIGGTQRFVATGTSSNATSADISNTVTWTSDASAVATVASPGVATGVSVGTATITATSGTQSGSATLTVTTAGAGVDLGRAASFAVLAGTALANANPTTVTGDVGAPSETLTPSIINGNNFVGAGNQSMLDALADVQVAIANVNGRLCNFSNSTATDFGGQVLAPGVHCVTGAMSVGSTLSLSTPGLYIFRATGVLTSADNVTVAFTGAATAANTNVSWVPAGGALIGASNTFLGTIMSSTGAITLGANTTMLPGRVMSGSAVTLSSNTIIKPIP
jgi:Bacterial Ig-like domain (group 2)/Ice-binding-like